MPVILNVLERVLYRALCIVKRIAVELHGDGSLSLSITVPYLSADYHWQRINSGRDEEKKRERMSFCALLK